MKKNITLKSGFLFLFLLSITHFSANSQSVIYGTDAPEGGYPFMVGIVDADASTIESGIICGGTLIRSDWVLTAAHCVTGLSAIGIEDLDIAIGSNSLIDLAPGHERIAAEEIFVHPNYNIGQNEFDIALIKLSSASQHSPIQLPSQGSLAFYQAGTAAKVLGWGIIDTMTFLPATYLQEANITIFSTETCNDPEHYNGQVTSNMICAGFMAGEAPTGGSAGDSGGPLIVENFGNWIQVGLVSWGETTWTTAQFPGVYQKTASHRNWIDDTIDSNGGMVPLKEINHSNLLNHIYYSNEQLNLSFNQVLVEELNLTVYDLLGRKHFQQKLPAGLLGDLNIILPTLPQGTYFVHLATEQTAFSYKFIR